MATLQELEAALRKAHAAGNAEHARAFAGAIRQMRSAQPAQGNGGVTRTPQEWADAEGLPVPGTDWRTPEQPARFQSPIPGGEFMNEAARSFAENVPVIGPLVDRAAQATGSQLASMITGGTPEDAQADRDYLRARDAAEQPIANAAGTVGGTVGPLMSLGTTKLGAQALGLQGPVAQRMAAGGASGGLISGADALARGENLADAGLQGAAGVGLGAALPLGERALNPIARMLFGGYNPPAAVGKVAQSLENARIDPADLPRLLNEMGPDAMILDLDKNLTRQAGGIASVPGQGGTILDEALTSRQAGANSRIQGEVNNILGEAPIPSRLATEIDANRKALAPFYDQALEGAKAVDTDAVALTLDSMIVNERGAAQNAARQVRQMLNVSGTDVLDPSPRTLLNTRHAIDGILYTDGAAAPLDSNIKRVLGQVRREIDAELAAKVPGIKDVDSRYSELARQGKAIETGEGVLASGRNEVIRPTELDDMLMGDATIVGPSGVPFRISQGTRAEIDRIIGTTGNDITALKQALKGDGSWNREKLASLYGQDRADQLVRLLEREQRYADSFSRITQNSETAARTAAQKDATPANISFDWQRLLFGLPEMAVNAGARARSQATNAAIADMLAGQASPELMQALAATQRANRGVIGSSAVPLLTNQ